MELVGARLAEAMQRGARLIFTPDPDRPIIRCLSPAAKAALAPCLDPAARAEAQRLMGYVATYRKTLLALYRLTSDGPKADHAAARTLVDDEARLIDDLGPALADAVRAQISAEWLQTTGMCPLCGATAHRSDE